MQRWSVCSMLKSRKQWFIGQRTQKLARISQADRLGISVFFTPIRYSETLLVRRGSVSRGRGGLHSSLEDSCWLLLSCCHPPVPSIPTHHWHWQLGKSSSPSALRFYTLSGQYFFFLNYWAPHDTCLKYSYFKDLTGFVTALSQLSNFLNSLSHGSAARMYQRWAVDAWNIDSWSSPPPSLLQRGLQTEEVILRRITVTVQI